MADAFRVVRDFEAALCEYTGAKYAVTVNSCTAALMLAVAWHLRPGQPIVWAKAKSVDQIMALGRFPKSEIEIPKRTYVGVPMSIIHAGGRPVFRDDPWRGIYQLGPLPVFDSARWFTHGMYTGVSKGGYISTAVGLNYAGDMQCVSFQASKTLGDSQGGAILHDNPEADAWLRRMRFDGRTEGVAPKDDKITEVGFHCYLSPDVAARLLHKLSSLPRHNDPLPWGPGTNSDYPDLSQMECFK